MLTTTSDTREPDEFVKSPAASATRPFSHQSAERRSAKHTSQASKSQSEQYHAAMLPVARMLAPHTLQEQWG